MTNSPIDLTPILTLADLADDTMTRILLNLAAIAATELDPHESDFDDLLELAATLDDDIALPLAALIQSMI